MRDSSLPKLLLLIGVPVLAAGVWFLTQGTGSSSAGVGLEPMAVEPDPVEPSNAAEPMGLVGPSEQPRVTERVADAGLEPSSAGRLREGQRHALPTSAIWVHGKVNLPDGTPLDEEVRVIANGRRFKNFPDQPDRYEAKIEPDGSFRVAFAPETSRGRLFIEARYVFLAEPLVVSPGLNPTGHVLEPVLGGRIEVEVLPPRAAAFDDDALAGLEVSAAEGMFFYMGAEQLKGRRLDEATFEIGGAQPNKQYTVRARSPIYADGEAAGNDVQPGQTQYLQVELSPGVKLEGRLVDEQGELVRGAKVLAMDREKASSRNPLFNRKVDDFDDSGDGTFLLRGVPPSEEIVLVVESEHHLEKQMSLGELTDGQQLTGIVVRMNTGGVIAGRVEWPDGEPAVGAEVRISQVGDMRGWDLERVVSPPGTRTDAEGIFRVTGLADGECAVSVACFEDGYVPPENATLRQRRIDPPPLWRAHIEEVQPGTETVHLILSEGSDIVGQVLDDAGDPVKNFQVVATPVGDGMALSTSLKAVKQRFKDDDGEFVLGGIMPGRWRVQARAVGYAIGDVKEVSSPVDEKIQLRLPRASRISGVVRTPDGKLKGKARVTARHGEGKKSQSETENGGEYTVTRIQPGRVTLTARADGWATSTPIELDLAPGANREDYIIYLRNGGTIEVELHASQEPREGRQVTLSGPGWNRKTTDAEGKARFTGLEPGDYTVELRPEGGGRGRRGGPSSWVLRNANQVEAEVSLKDEQTVRVVLGEPPPNAVTVRGRVLSGGEVVPGALITVTAMNSGEAEAAAEAEADGTYEVVLPEPGDWRFLVGRKWDQQSSFNETIPAGTTFTLDFELPDGGLTGTVRGPGGRVQNNVALTVTRVEDGKEIDTGWLGRRQVNTDSEGNYRFDELAPGTYNLRATHGGRNREQPTGTALVKNIEVEGETTRDVQLPQQAVLEGSVVDASGSPVGGARVQIQTSEGFRVRTDGDDEAGDDGEFEIDRLGPDAVRVRARSSGGWGEWKQVQLREGGRTTVTLITPVPGD